MKIPYGISDFYALRTEGHFYVDRTSYLRTFEDLGKSLLLLRPRRFGKSLWLRTLACFYDLRTAAEHERLFGDLEIGRHPGEDSLAHRYFVLEWDFSRINPDPPPRGVNAGVTSRTARIGNEMHSYLNGSMGSFASDYREHLPEGFTVNEGDAFRTLNNLLAAVRRTPHKLYLLVDEYDNFANEVMTADPDAYHELVHTDGPFKYLFKWVKSATAGQGLDRLFITGVSPMVMSDVTSGLNIARGVYQHPRLAALCGFTDAEVDELLDRVAAERDDGAVDLSEAKAMVREWYDGYRFTPDAEKIYNPTLTLYFLLHLRESGEYPRQMLDSNLATDEGKLEHLGRVASGQDAVVRLIRSGEPLEVSHLEEGFTLRAMLDRSAQDATFVGSYLYYFGMLTHAGETARRTLLLAPPNLVVQALYVDQIRRFLLPDGEDRSAAEPPAWDVTEGRSIEPLLDFIETTVFAALSNRDARGSDERMVKIVFVCLLWNELNYVMLSEPELERGYADLCLLRRPDARTSNLKDLLFEFKRLPLGQVGMTGEEVRSASREDLARRPEVREALDAAESQLGRYREGLERRCGDLSLDAWAVVALGFDRLVARAVVPS